MANLDDRLSTDPTQWRLDIFLECFSSGVLHTISVLFGTGCFPFGSVVSRFADRIFAVHSYFFLAVFRLGYISLLVLKLCFLDLC